MNQITLYGVVGLLVTSIGLGVALNFTMKRNKKLKEELTQVEESYRQAQINLVRVSDQLSREARTREVAEAALEDLRSIPDVDFNTPLPDSVSRVLDGFHHRLLQQNNDQGG